MVNHKTKKCSCGKKICKASERCRSCANRNRKGKYHMKNSHFGKDSNNWKGNKAGIGAIHRWMERHKPKPKFCESCGKAKPYELANISGKYKRDLNDFRWLCRKCHMKEDGRLKFFKKYVGQNKPKWKKRNK